MGHSSVVVFLAFAVCFVSCELASADGNFQTDQNTQVGEVQVKEAVDDAKKSIKEVSDKAQYNIGNATLILQKVEEFKKQADDAASQAQSGEGNAKAKAIVDNVKNSAESVNTLYGNAITELESANSSMVQLLTEIKTLEDQCSTVLPLTDPTSEKYTTAKNTATGIKTKADKLNTNINAASKIISAVESKLQQMEESAKKAQVENLRVSGIVAFTKIETKIKEADGIIQETQNKRNLVNGIVEEMQKHCTTELIGSNKIIEMQCKSATDELKKATSAVENATKDTEEMTEQKDSANAALAKVNTETTIENAKNKVDTTKACVTAIENIIKKLNNALESVDLSLKNANALKKNLETALSTTTTTPSTKEVKETEVANPQVEDGTDSHQQDATEKPTSKDSLDHKDNSGDILKDTLSNGVQNGTTAPLIGKNVPAPGAKNDSAMTVSVPLLVALIASTVLQ